MTPKEMQDMVNGILDKAIPYKDAVNDALSEELEILEKPIYEELIELEKSDIVKRYIEASAKLRYISRGQERLSDYYGK